MAMFFGLMNNRYSSDSDGWMPAMGTGSKNTTTDLEKQIFPIHEQVDKMEKKYQLSPDLKKLLSQ